MVLINGLGVKPRRRTKNGRDTATDALVSGKRGSRRFGQRVRRPPSWASAGAPSPP